jgi:hypothetical protein
MLRLGKMYYIVSKKNCCPYNLDCKDNSSLSNNGKDAKLVIFTLTWFRRYVIVDRGLFTIMVWRSRNEK